MAVLAIMVGVAAIAVNRYSVRRQSDLIETILPAMQLASRIGETTEVVSTLATAFVHADTPEDLKKVASALGLAVSKIEAGARELEGINPLPPDNTSSEAAKIVERMARNGQEELRLSIAIARAGGELGRVGDQLDRLVEAETDLARLKITAGIAGIYAGQEPDLRSSLDTLADRYFFAFERLAELARMVDTIRLKFQQVPDIVTADEVARLTSELDEQIELAAGRITYLPTGAAQQEVTALIQTFRDALAVEGLIDLQRMRIALQNAIATDSEDLRLVISSLSDRARQARDAVQATGLAHMTEVQRVSSQMTAALLAWVIAAVIAGAVLWLYARKQLVARLANLSAALSRLQAVITARLL
ncbi:hypothetical protein [Pseudorhodobacter aquimaris]|uniref:hypothetical protein n=1 Tax=Pseudorhodobacter aquimaris TaxID=687412 RepID=UPI001E4EC397|nr:hypothetical protein [Pseudorhodobacter aquimaris]